MNSPIYLIGTGNLAWHIAGSFSSASIPIKGIWGRNQDAAKEISCSFHLPQIEKEKIFKMEGIFILTISDSEIKSLANKLPENSTIIHTSGSTSLNILTETHSKAGVFYPLQTFSKYKNIEFEKIPILIEYTDDNIKTLLEDWALKLKTKSFICSSLDRMNYHIAAVFTCNFVNHMIALAEQWLITNNLSFDLLKPLITETIHKAIEQGALNSQTGPAVRNDQITIEKHLKVLENNPDLKKIYSFVTQSIITNLSKK